MNDPPRQRGALAPASAQAPARRGSWCSLLACSRDAFRLRAILPVWLALLILEQAGAVLPREGRSAWLALVAMCFAFLLGPWVALSSLRVRPTMAAQTRAWALSLRPFFFAAAGTLVTPVFFLALGAAGALLGRIPSVGVALGEIWFWTGGLVLALLAAGWLVVGIPSLLLQVTAAAVEFPHSFELVTRTTSYVRREPLRFAAGSIGAVLGATLGTVAFGAFLLLGLVALAAFRDVAGGSAPDLARAAAAIAALISAPETWCPWASAALWDAAPPGSASPWGAALLGGAASLGGGGGALQDAGGTAAAALVRLAPAFWAASFVAGLSRLYLLLRERIDGTPPEEIYDSERARGCE